MNDGSPAVASSSSRDEESRNIANPVMVETGGQREVAVLSPISGNLLHFNTSSLIMKRHTHNYLLYFVQQEPYLRSSNSRKSKNFGGWHTGKFCPTLANQSRADPWDNKNERIYSRQGKFTIYDKENLSFLRGFDRLDNLFLRGFSQRMWFLKL